MSALGKVFGIGLSKTGNTSLTMAMGALGYRALINPTTAQWERLDAYDFVCDMPTQMRWRELAQRYPSARFILTVRDVDDWAVSIRRWLAGGVPADVLSAAYRKEQFGECDGGMSSLAEIYETHTRDVRAYFATRPGALLVINVCAGDGWEKLISWLKPPFPRTSQMRRRCARA